MLFIIYILIFVLYIKLTISQQDSALRGASNLAPHVVFDESFCKKPFLWGNAHSGGWMICLDSLIKGCIVYSFGLGADWSFDNAAERYGCTVHGFDPTGMLWSQGMYGSDYTNIDYPKQYPSKNKYFHHWGLGSAEIATYPKGTVPQEWPGLGDPAMSKSNPISWEMRSINRTLHDLNHVTNLDVLKIDVEGAEWDAMIAFINTITNPNSNIKPGMVKQLLLEWHWDPDSRYLITSLIVMP